MTIRNIRLIAGPAWRTRVGVITAPSRPIDTKQRLEEIDRANTMEEMFGRIQFLTEKRTEGLSRVSMIVSIGLRRFQ